MSYTLEDVMEDMHARLVPSPAAVRHARALLDFTQDADLAAIPMYLPGKTHGVWTMGQDVVTVPGAVFLGVNGFDVPADSPVPSYSIARHLAGHTAREYAVISSLDSGTSAYATVSRDGHVAVFEDF